MRYSNNDSANNDRANANSAMHANNAGYISQTVYIKTPSMPKPVKYINRFAELSLERKILLNKLYDRGIIFLLTGNGAGIDARQVTNSFLELLLTKKELEAVKNES